MSWVERVALPAALLSVDRYRLHQVVARAAHGRSERVLWARAPGGLLVRSPDGALRWDRGIERVSVERDRLVPAGETLVVRGAVCAARRSNVTGHLSPVPEGELLEWAVRHASRSGLRDVILRSASGAWESAQRARDNVRLTWHAYEMEFTAVVAEPAAWAVARAGGWGKAKGFGFGLLVDSPLTI